MKIAIISQNASPGIMIFRKDFVRYLTSLGHEVYCLAIDYTREEKKTVEGWGAVPIDYTLNKSGVNPIQDLFDMLRLSKILKSFSPDVVLSCFIKPSIYGTLAAKFAGVPRRIALLEGLGYIHTDTGNSIEIKKNFLKIIHGFLSSVSFLVVHKIIFLNNDDPRDLSRVAFFSKKKAIVLGPIGLDLSSYPYSKTMSVGPMRFIFVARLLSEKGINEFVEAARIVHRQCPDVEFIALGAPDEKNPSSLSVEKIKSIVDEGVVMFPGYVSDVTKWVAKAHVFVLPSYREGMPRSVQEAMAIGRPVITTDVPGCRDVVVDNVSGFLVPPRDPDALADRMLHFIRNPDEVERMGVESNRIAVESYDVNKINPVLSDLVVGAKKNQFNFP